MRQQLRAWLALWWVAAGPAATAGAPVRITLDLAGEGREPVAARLELSPERREGQGTLESRSIPLTAPGQLEIDLPKVVWHATAQAPGFWSETRVFVPRAGPAGEAIALRLFPIGVVKAEVEVPPGERSPASLTASFAAAPGRAAAEGPQGTVSCPIGERRLHCSLPAGRFDLQLRADGFAPAYLWDVQVQAGAEKALGLVRLWRGSSVSGRVEMADGLPAPGEVELGLQTAGVPLPETARRLGLLARRVQANERGFFQFLDVPPGTYELTVARAGFAPARAAPVVVREGLETQLIEPLVLAPPAVFEVAVSPPADPYGRAWRLRLMEKVAGTVQAGGVIAGSANPEGRWERSGLPPGSYRLSIEDQDGSRWAVEEVEVAPGRPPVEIVLPLVEVRGRVRRGKEPLAATLWFGGRAGARRVRFDADEEGRFEGVLPEEGTWRVELVAEEAGLKLAVPPVEVKRRKGSRVAEVEVLLSDTTLAGRSSTMRAARCPRPLSPSPARVSGCRRACVAATSEDASRSGACPRAAPSSRPKPGAARAAPWRCF